MIALTSSIIMLILSVPVFAVIILLTIYLYKQQSIPLTAIIIEFMRLGSMPSLVAIPLFSFAGFILAHSNAPKRLFNLLSTIFGNFKGGIVLAAIISASIFTAFSGASGITVIALGGLIYQILKEAGYSDKFSLGLISTTGSLGLLIPPSLPIILYSVVAKIDINILFKKSLTYAILIIIVFYLYSLTISKKMDIPKQKFSLIKIKNSLIESAWEIPLPIFVVGGIYMGIITASEAATITVVYVIVVECFIKKEVKINELLEISKKTMLLVGAIFIVLASALAFTNYIVDAQIPENIFNFISKYITNKYLFLIILNIIILAINMIEIFSAIIIVVPIIVPVAINYGIDPLHLAIIFLINLELGYMTPPFGINLFLSSMRFNKKLTEIYRYVIPWWLIIFTSLIIATYIKPF
ncbi:MAG: TRAP transporter large permease subunit [Candidatus Goldbacteria bacterium]|nr:TRAP transporter large permease subunit [Candidatus Goldiibacteriota bacterium]